MKKTWLKISIISILALAVLAGCAMGPRAESIPGISADGDSVYVSYRQHVYKLNAKSGTESWRFPVKASTTVMLYAPALVKDGKVYVGDLANTLHNLTADNGTETWSSLGAKGWYQAKVAIDGDLMVAPNTDRNVYGVNLDGSLKWTYKGNFAFLAEPVFVDGKVMISSQDHELLALDRETGEEIWSAPFKGGLVAAPLYDPTSDLLFAGSLGKDFLAIKPETGEVAWSFKDASDVSSIWSTPILIKDQLIFSDEAGSVFSVNPETGALNWRVNAGGDMIAGPLALEDSFVLATEDGVITRYDLDRNPIWTKTVDGQIYGTPVLAGDVFLVGTIKGANILYAFDFKGNQLWSFMPAN